MTVTDAAAVEKAREAKILRSTSGCAMRSSHQAKTASAASPAASPASVTVAVQPRPGASMMASTMANSAPPMSTVPGMSRRWPPGSAVSGTVQMTPASATATSGMLMRNTLPHQKWESSRPPSVGPITMPMLVTADQAAIACGRSFGGKTAFRIDSVAGMTNAAPRPITTRAPISMPVPDANAAVALPRANTARPPSSESRRPYRSPSAPAGMSSAAKHSV
jgi:hypothetical protein